MSVLQELTKELINLQFPINKTRTNIFKEGDTCYEGFVAGYVRERFRGVNKRGYSLALKKNPKKCQRAYELAVKLGEEINDDDFKFTSIQFNKNYQIAKHIDRFNAGKSYIIALGDYEGGELLVYFEGKDSPPTKVDIKNKFFTFDGYKYYHEVAPFTGNRISLVYYSVEKHTDIYKEDFIKKINNMDYVIAVSFKEEEHNEESLNKILDEYNESGLSKKVFVFFPSADLQRKYKKVLDGTKYNTLVMGDRRNADQSDFIKKYFPPETEIVYFN